MAEKNMTIEDIAKALNVSKTTVSRAISGKGRISEETRERVRKYIEKSDYRPNLIAKSLAESKSYNIGFVMPADYSITDMSFFQKCLWGISQMATRNDYDVMVAIVSSTDLSLLERIVDNKKVDGVILARTYSTNTIEQFLRTKNMPFVTVGSSVDSTVFQVDNDHESACMDLTVKLIKSGLRKLALIGADTKIIANRNRYHGYRKAFESLDLKVYEERIFLNKNTDVEINQSVEWCIENEMDCILCMDDEICAKVLAKLNSMSVQIPKDICIASFYNSHILKGYPFKITAINFDEVKLGEVACKSLLDRLNHEDPVKRLLLGYEISIQESTKKERRHG